jgi:hypothetical protein
LKSGLDFPVTELIIFNLAPISFAFPPFLPFKPVTQNRDLVAIQIGEDHFLVWVDVFHGASLFIRPPDGHSRYDPLREGRPPYRPTNHLARKVRILSIVFYCFSSKLIRHANQELSGIMEQLSVFYSAAIGLTVAN